MGKKSREKRLKKLRAEGRPRRDRTPPAAPTPDPTRNAEAEKGRRVLSSELAVYALPLHARCNGKGITSRKVVGEGEEAQRLAVPCSCATKRFLRAHPEVILDEAGNAWWPMRRPTITEAFAAPAADYVAERTKEGT